MKWFEIAIWPRKTSEEVPEFLAPDQVTDSFQASSPSRKRNRTGSARRSQRGRLHSDSGLYSKNLLSSVVGVSVVRILRSSRCRKFWKERFFGE